MIKIKFLDGNVKEFAKGITLADIADGISKSLRKKTIAGYVNGELYDLTRQILDDSEIKLITLDDDEAEHILSHSAAHLLAQAVKRIYPDAKFGIGPAIENGFYYDIDTKEVIREEDLKKIEKEMNKIVSEAIPVERMVVSKEEALKIFADNEYKTELINELDDQEITLYKQGDFIDLCRGAHVENTKVLKHFKLLSVAGAYWRGDSNNKMLQRIYGVIKPSKEALDNYLIMLEEAKKRDHRKLGKELKLFMMSDYGPGLPFFLPNGMILKEQILKYWNQVHLREGYETIQTPIMLNRELWETSGHWFNYRENMYTSEIDGKEFAIKPMNCPGGMLVFDNEIRSYKDLPIKYAELGIVHRHEASGALHGLFRVRNFTQDDAHIFMTPDQIEEEVVKLIDLYAEIYSAFDLDFYIELSTMPEKAIGDPEIWKISEEALAKACKASGHDYILNPGDGAFYGPKLDFKLKDSIGRVWQCGTIQLDMNLPERFDLSYIDKDGNKQRPIMLHRALLGSIERFMGILIENYAGAFPTWLAPEQIRIIPVADTHKAYAQQLEMQFKELGLRPKIEKRDEKLGYLIRDAQINKIPYTLVIGDNEVNDNTVTYRQYGSTEQINVPIDVFVGLIEEDIASKGK